MVNFSVRHLLKTHNILKMSLQESVLPPFDEDFFIIQMIFWALIHFKQCRCQYIEQYRDGPTLLCLVISGCNVWKAANTGLFF